MSEQLHNITLKHEPGDVLTLKVVEDLVGEPADLRPWRTTNAIVRYVVFEVLVQMCSGGMQITYRCRGVRADGVCDRLLIDLAEHEVVAAPPFRRAKPQGEAGDAGADES